MKKLFAISVAALVALSAYAGLDAYQSMTYTTVMPATRIVASGTNAVVDMSGAKGIGALVVNVSAPETNAVGYGSSVALYTCATTDGTFTAVSGASVATGVATSRVVKVDSGALSRYVKAVYVVSNDACVASAQLVFAK